MVIGYVDRRGQAPRVCGDKYNVKGFLATQKEKADRCDKGLASMQVMNRLI